MFVASDSTQQHCRKCPQINHQGTAARQQCSSPQDTMVIVAYCDQFNGCNNQAAKNDSPMQCHGENRCFSNLKLYPENRTIAKSFKNRFNPSIVV